MKDPAQFAGNRNRCQQTAPDLSFSAKQEYYFRSPIFLAGTPAHISLGAIDFVTTAPAATIAPSPIVTPLSTTAFTPIHTLFPIVIAASVLGCVLMSEESSVPWLWSMNLLPEAINASLPMVIPVLILNSHPVPINTLLPICMHDLVFQTPSYLKYTLCSNAQFSPIVTWLGHVVCTLWK